MQEQRDKLQIKEPEEHTCSAASAPGPTPSGKGPSMSPLYTGSVNAEVLA